MKTLGVIGGLGPMATAYFMELITEMTDVDQDQKHIHMLIDSRPATPDRTGYILGLSKESPLPVMTETGLGLKAWGADLLAIPCNTSHYFHGALEEAIGLPILHQIRETVKILKEKGVKKAGIMGTDGTVQSGLYQNELLANGIEPVVPEPEYQRSVMHVIYDNVKANRPPEMEHFRRAERHLRQRGAEVLILGCTELSVVKNEYEIGPDFLDAMDALARASVLACGAPLKPEYDELITR